MTSENGMRDKPPPLPLSGFRLWWPWAATVILLLWQVDFQFTYGFYAEPIQRELGLTSSEASIVAAVYLVSYGLMQIPAGLLIDRFGVARLLPLMGSGAAGSVLFFAHGQTYEELVAARLLAGIFMAFVFPSAGKIARIRLRPEHFPLAMAIADMCFGLGAVLAGSLSTLFSHIPWRNLMSTHGFVGIAITMVLAASLRRIRNPTTVTTESPLLSIRNALSRRNVLLGIGIYVWGAGLTFGFGGYWNLKLQESCGCTAPQVSELSSALFGGLAAGMLLAGILGGEPDRRRFVLRMASIGALLGLVLVLWASPFATTATLSILMVGLGLCLGASALSFAVAVSGLPPGPGGTVVALVNAGGCLSGALFQELPLWLGRGTAGMFEVSVVYVTVSILGIVMTWSLPRHRGSE